MFYRTLLLIPNSVTISSDIIEKEERGRGEAGWGETPKKTKKDLSSKKKHAYQNQEDRCCYKVRICATKT